jgi:AraC family transcriptional regulator of arabinose operon
MPVLFPHHQEGLYTRVFSAGYLTVDQWWCETDLLRGFWRLYLNEQDGVALRLGRKTFAMPRGQLVLVPPGLDFEIELRGPVDQLFTQFEFLGWPPEAARDLLPEPIALPPDDLRDTLAARLCKELAAARVRLDPVLAGRVKALIHLSIAGVLAELPEDKTRRVLRINEGQREMLAVLHYIDEHLEEPMSNARLAEIALSSESRFIRRFREATGRTPARYVQERRLERASQLLVSTDYSIDRIAEASGFANRYYFTRVFTQRMGLPPGRYRSERPLMPADAGEEREADD